MSKSSPIVAAYLVPGHPHILLAPEKSPGWASLRESYGRVAQEIAATKADLILVYSTQWLSVIGHQVQADPHPEWVHVDDNWYELGTMRYSFRMDADFAHVLVKRATRRGLTARTVAYGGFPLDTGSIVALQLANPENRLPAVLTSCNIYAGKKKSILWGKSARDALEREGRRAVVLVVSNLSSRYFTHDIDPARDRVSSAKDDEWNRKVLALLGRGRLEDVVQVARTFAREANADMGFKGIWWLAGLLGRHNHHQGEVLDYQAVWGTGAAVVRLTPPGGNGAEPGEGS